MRSRKMQSEQRNEMFALRPQRLKTKPQTAVFKRPFFLSLHILMCTTDGSVVPEEERAAYVLFPEKHGAFTFRRERKTAQ